MRHRAVLERVPRGGDRRADPGASRCGRSGGEPPPARRPRTAETRGDRDRMTTTAAFLARLRRLDVQVRFDEGRLRCSAREGVVTPAIQQELSRRKDEIRVLLSNAVDSNALPSVPIACVPRDRQLPPSFGQQRLWFIERMAPDVAVFNLTSALCLDGPLDVAALQWSLAGIVRRHEILRTTFALVDGEMTQVGGEPYVPCTAVDAPIGSSPDERGAWMRRVLHEERARKFD